jgi:hypothetical protein
MVADWCKGFWGRVRIGCTLFMKRMGPGQGENRLYIVYKRMVACMHQRQGLHMQALELMWVCIVKNGTCRLVN